MGLFPAYKSALTVKKTLHEPIQLNPPIELVGWVHVITGSVLKDYINFAQIQIKD